MSLARVHIVDDDPSVRDSTAVLLGLNGLMTRVFPSAEAFLAACREDWEGCLLLDLKMPGMGGLDLMEELARREIRLPVVVVTAHGDVATVRAALKRGALDFLQKPVEKELLLEVIVHAIAHDAETRQAAKSRSAQARLLARLTTRERQVMDLVVSGKANRDIAAELGISRRTVEVYKYRMMEKLQADSLAEVIRVALGAAPPGRKP